MAAGPPRGRAPRRPVVVGGVLLLGMIGTLLAQEGAPRFARPIYPLTLADTELTALERDFVTSHPVLRVGIARDPYPPFLQIDDGAVSGQAIEFLQAVAGAIGFELEVRLYDTFPEVLAALERREADLTPAASVAPERERYLDFTVGVVPNPAGLVGRIGDDRFATDPQLVGMRVGVGVGLAAESYLPDQFPLALPVPLPSVGPGLSRLVSGELDYYYGDLADVLFASDRRVAEQLEIKQRVFFGSGWNHVAVRSDWPLLVRMIDRFAQREHGQADSWPGSRPDDDIGRRLRSDTPPLSLSPDEVAFLSDLEVLRVGSTAGVPLLDGIDDHGDHVGIASEFTAYLSYRIGRAVELRGYPTVEAMLGGLERREIDLIPYFAITEERKRELAFSRPYLTMPWLAFGRREGAPFWDLGSLRGHTLALRGKHPLLPLIRERYPQIEILVTDSAADSVDAVLDARADASIETKLHVNRETQRSGGRLRVLGEVRDDDGRFAFAARRQDIVLVRIIDKALATMSPDLADRVVRRWVAIDFEPERRLRNQLRVLVPVLGAACVFLLATLYWNRRIARENLRRIAAERRLVDMTEGLTSGVFQCRHRPGESVKMVFANRVTREMARLPAADDGQRMAFLDHIDPRDRQAVTDRLERCLADGQRFRESFRFDFPGGEKGWILADAQCLDERDGARLWNGYLFDLTAERMMSEELNAMLASRNEFVSTASHELRTPVQNIALALDAIDRSGVDPGQLARIEIARSAASDLEELVDDIVQLTGMNHHSPSFASESFDLHELIQTVCRTFSVMAMKKSLGYTVHIDDALRRTVRGDPLRLKQILYNIVGNAIKYTDAGSVTVRAMPGRTNAAAVPEGVASAGGTSGIGLGRVGADEAGMHASAAAGSDATAAVRIIVSDTGIGIPANALEGIFKPFTTVGPSSRGSSGLGLALCDRLAAVMGARIEVSSIEGEGSTFAISLRLATEAGRPSSGVPIAGDAAPGVFETTSKAILIVDDDPVVSELLATLLEAEGWPTRQAGSSQEAIELLDGARFRAVLTDQRMPGMNGTELARRIRASFADGAPRPVLILMTGGLRREDAASSPGLFDAMLFKPVKTGEIVKAIEDCRHGRNTSPAADAASWGEGTLLMRNA